MNAERVDVVLVEDDPNDVELILRVFRKHHTPNQIILLKDGAEALDFFFPPGRPPAGPADGSLRIVLLDLKLPKVDGIEVLRRLKSHALTREIPVVILTSSCDEQDMRDAYELGVNSYVTKPIQFDVFAQAVADLGRYWVTQNKLPRIDILILEDDGADAELMQRELRKAGLEFTARWAPDQATFAAALERAMPDVILADYTLPGFDGLTALTLARQRWAEVPVVIVSGAIGEERAIATLKAGATDYVLKQRLSRLGPVVQRALVEARARAEKRQAEEALREANATLETKVAQRTAELQRRTQQLQRLTLELTQAEDRERRRIAVLLHEDVQQQIAGAKFHLSRVKGRVQDARTRADLEEVEAMLKDAIEQSRSLSRDLSPAVVNMNDLAEVLQWLANRVQAQQGLTVQMDVRGDLVLDSEALALFLFRAAQEMLFNVVKHAQVREAGVRVRRIGRWMCLSVSDRGQGFDPRELKETAGVGLFSIRERTELLGGRMKVKSIPGQGSRLHIVVPDGQKPVGVGPRAYPLPTEARGQAHPASAGTDGKGKEGGHGGRPLRVLLVDDHDIVRQGLAAMLRGASGIELVGEAADGRKPIEMAVDLRPDVVLMDVSMPFMKGDEATRRIKTYLPEVRVIALSMYDEPDKKQGMFDAGAENYLLKTICAEDLLAALRGPNTDRS